MIDQTVNALRNNNFAVHVMESGISACDYLLGQLQPGLSVGLGGSLTLEEIGLYKQLTLQNIILYNQYEEGLSRAESLEIRRKGLLSDIYFSGSNAVTADGEIVNVDGVGNRVAAFSYGPKKVFIVIGRNKIVSDYAGALDRIRNHAAPLNAKRLKRNTPCVTDGKCHDCTSEERICNIIHVLKKQPIKERINVIIINEELGL